MYRERSFVEYLQDLRNRVFRIAIAVGVVTALCMTFSISFFNFDGYKIPLLRPDPFNNIAIQVILALKENLLPQNVNFIQITPLGAFSTQINVAALLGIILVMPIIVRELAAFIGPGLYQHEKAIVKKFTTSAIGLFAMGCLFSYFVVIPYVLNFLYKYGQSIGVSTFFDIANFVPFVMQFLIIFGLSYQLPIIMWITTVSGMVEYKFWRHKLKYAVIIIAVVGAVISPDGSGVTMWFAKRLLWYLFAGSKGGNNRIKIIDLLKERPYNINQLAEALGLDYKAIQHHITVLERNTWSAKLVKNMECYILSPITLKSI